MNVRSDLDCIFSELSSPDVTQGSLPLSPNGYPEYWKEIDLSTIETAATSSQIDLEALLTPIEPEEDGRIIQLEQFLSCAVMDLLLLQINPQEIENFKGNLQNYLAPCTAILSPPDKLQFLRDLARLLTSDKNTFECRFDSHPYNLPLPLSLDWLPNRPVNVKIDNPALRALLTRLFNPTSYQPYFLELIQRLVTQLLTTSQQENHTQDYLVTIGQLPNLYECRLKINHIILLFFSEFFAKTAESYPEHDFSTILRDFYTVFRFTAFDLRSGGKVVSGFPFPDHLIVSQSLSTIVAAIKPASRDSAPLVTYLCGILNEGVLRSETMLSDHILLSLFHTAAWLVDKADQTNVPCYSLPGFLFDAMEIIAKKNPSLADKILQIPYFKKIKQGDSLRQPNNYSLYVTSRDRVEFRKYNSFIIRDLLAASNIDWQKLKPTPDEIAQARAPIFERKIARGPTYIKTIGTRLLSGYGIPGLHVVTHSPEKLESFSMLLFEAIFITEMFHGWSEAKKRVDKSELVNRFLNLCTAFLKRTQPVSWFENCFGSAIMGLFTLLDREVLLQALTNDLKIFKSPCLELALCAHIRKLINIVTRDAEQPKFRQAVLPIIDTVLLMNIDKTARAKKFAEALNTLRSLCLQSPTAEQLSKALEVFTKPIQGKNVNLLFAEIFFRGSLASMRYSSMYCMDVPESLLMKHMDFRMDNFQVCPDAASLSLCFNLYERGVNNKYMVCITTPETYQSLAKKFQVGTLTHIVDENNSPVPGVAATMQVNSVL